MVLLLLLLLGPFLRCAAYFPPHSTWRASPAEVETLACPARPRRPPSTPAATPT